MDIDTTARGIRRRSSFGPSEDQQSDSEITSAEQLLAGGNWHGASGDPALETYEREHEETTKVKNIEKIIMGDYEVEAWYYSPFPAEYSNLETLYVCEYCLSYMKKVRTFLHHRATCTHRHPPGKQIYREEDICVYELDGKDHRAYCQKLCLLAKLFLDHKTLFFEPKPFLFYVVAKVDDTGAHIVGYFSKEKVRNVMRQRGLLSADHTSNVTVYCILDLGSRIQPGMYSHFPSIPEMRLRKVYYIGFLRAHQTRRQNRFSGKASVGSRKSILP